MEEIFWEGYWVSFLVTQDQLQMYLINKWTRCILLTTGANSTSEILLAIGFSYHLDDIRK